MKKSIYSAKQKILCDLLAKGRKAAGLTQIQLAAKLGKPQSFVAKFEGGERRLDFIELIEVADTLGLDISLLLKKLQ